MPSSAFAVASRVASLGVLAFALVGWVVSLIGNSAVQAREVAGARGGGRHVRPAPPAPPRPPAHHSTLPPTPSKPPPLPSQAFCYGTCRPLTGLAWWTLFFQLFVLLLAAAAVVRTEGWRGREEGGGRLRRRRQPARTEPGRPRAPRPTRAHLAAATARAHRS